MQLSATHRRSYEILSLQRVMQSFSGSEDEKKVFMCRYIRLYERLLSHWFSELGEEYCPPSQYLLPVLESDCGKQNSDSLDGLEEAWQVQ